MNTQQHSNKKPEVYSISGFKDTLASPVFYPVIVVALVLGITSIFGFVQNPLKLKSIVSVIQQKVAESNVAYEPINSQKYFEGKKAEHKFHKIHNPSVKSYDFFSHNAENSTEKMPIEGDFERITFNYDVTSESFWKDLDSSSLETAAEKMERKEKDAATFGSPLRIDQPENQPSADFLDDSIYAINSINKT